MNDKIRRAGGVFFGLLYLAAALGFMCYPMDTFDNQTVMCWLISTFDIGDPILNALWLFCGTFGFLGVGILLIAVQINTFRR